MSKIDCNRCSWPNNARHHSHFSAEKSESAFGGLFLILLQRIWIDLWLQYFFFRSKHINYRRFKIVDKQGNHNKFWKFRSCLESVWCVGHQAHKLSVFCWWSYKQIKKLCCGHWPFVNYFLKNKWWVKKWGFNRIIFCQHYYTLMGYLCVPFFNIL